MILIKTVPLPIFKAVSTESARRFFDFSLTTKRSTTASIVCFFFLSSSISLSDSTISLSILSLMNPSIRASSIISLCSPFFPLINGAKTIMREPSSNDKIESTICSTVCWLIGSRHFTQCWTPMRAKRRRI